jgi:signal transduction histidine kinase
VKFTPAGGDVSLRTYLEGGTVVFVVRDTGIGIEKEHLPHLFEAFRQGDAKLARSHEGSGLGLSITKGLVEMHGGSISLESELGEGTVVTVRLPRRTTMVNAA